MRRSLIALLLFCCPFVAAQPGLADVSIRGIHTNAERDATRVVIDLSEMTRYQYGILPADARARRPPRVYVDVHGVTLGSQDGAAMSVSDSRVTRIRTGQHKDGIARIVVEVQGRLTPKILSLETPPRIVVELSGPGLAELAAAPAPQAKVPSGQQAPAEQAKAATSPAAGSNQSGGTARAASGAGNASNAAGAKVSPSALARLQTAESGKGVVTLKGTGPAGSNATPVQPEATARFGAATNTVADTKGEASQPEPRGPQPRVVAGRGTAIQPVTPGRPMPPAADGPTGQRDRAAPPARASQVPAVTGPLASNAPEVRPPVQAGRGTELLPMPPLPAGVKPAFGAPASPPKAKRVRVVLDPGHGGKDPGAQGPGGAEKDSVLDIALRVAAKLRRTLGVEVYLTRSDDTYVSLAERKDLANRVEADLFVSIHANASRNSSLYGIETYYLKNSNDRATLRLARLENGVDMLIKGNDVSTDADLNYILSDIIQGQKESDSVLLANHIQNQLCSSLGKRYDAIHSLGVKQGPFLVLDGTYMPSVLVETGFITNRDEGRRLGASSYREVAADGIYRGIKAYLEDERVNDLT